MEALSISKEILLTPFLKAGPELNRLSEFGRRNKTEFMEDTKIIEDRNEVNLLKVWVDMPEI